MKLFQNFKAARNRLTHVGENEPLNFLSIVVIIALDIFVLWNVFQGVAFQTSQLTSANEAVPYQCKQLAGIDYRNDSRWETIESVLSKNNYYSRANSDTIADCVALMDAADTLSNETVLASNFNKIKSLRESTRKLENENRNYENSYDTLLLEKIANQGDEDSITNSRADQVKSDIGTRQAGINKNKNREQALKNEILNHPDVVAFMDIRNTKSQLIEAQYKDLQFWYPIKKLTFRLIFLLPLLFVFTMLYRHSVKRNKPLLTLIFSHLLVVTCIPIVIEVLDLFFQILPFHLLADLLDLLESWNLVALWNYFLILFGIAAALGLIYLAQKKLFARERMMLKRIAAQQCCGCGTKLKSDVKHCYKCGVANLKNCKHCNGLTFVEGANCRECGKSDF